MDNFIFITIEADPIPIAYRLKEEGKNVVVGLLDDPFGDMTPDILEKRSELYQGMIDVESGEEVMKWMKEIPNKDEWFVMFDYGNLWPWSEEVLGMGFSKGIFPTEEGYSLEQDRSKGKEFAEKHYSDLKVCEASEFSKVEEAIDFLSENEDKVFVLKSNGSEAETVVPITDDPKLAHLQLKGALASETKGYEKGGFTLEEKIPKPIEISPVMVFWEGVPLFSLVELENKGFGCSNIGRLTGGCQNLSIRTDLDCPLNKIAFPPIIYEMASKQPGIGIYDAGMLYDGKQFCFTEFCSQRWGWDGVFSELVMCRNGSDKFTSRHFDLISEGKNPLVNNFGAAVRLFQTHPDKHKKGVYQDGYSMNWLPETESDLFFYCIRKDEELDDNPFVSVGYKRDLGVAVGASDFMEAAVDQAYEAIKNFAMTGVYFRPKFDFMSRNYFTSIMNRYHWLINSGLI